MSKNPTKGMRGVSIEFAGKHRLLKYSHGLIGDLEQEANKILAPLHNKGEMTFAPGIFGQWLGNSKIFSLALLYGLKHEDADLTLTDIDGTPASKDEKGDVIPAKEGMIDAYEGSLDDLGRQMVLAFRMARDPSSVASLQASWKNSDETRKIMEEAGELQDKAARMQAENGLREAKERMAKIKKEVSGQVPPASEPSSA